MRGEGVDERDDHGGGGRCRYPVVVSFVWPNKQSKKRVGPDAVSKTQ